MTLHRRKCDVVWMSYGDHGMYWLLVYVYVTVFNLSIRSPYLLTKILTFEGRSRWLSRMRDRLVIRRLRVRSSPGPATFLRGDWNLEIFSTAILSLPLIQEGQLSVSVERMYISTGYPLSGLWLPMKNWPARHDHNSVDMVLKIQTKA